MIVTFAIKFINKSNSGSLAILDGANTLTTDADILVNYLSSQCEFKYQTIRLLRLKSNYNLVVTYGSLVRSNSENYSEPKYLSEVIQILKLRLNNN